MSAAASAAAPTRAASFIKGGNWTPTPRAYFRRLFGIFSGLEMAVLGNILDESIGGPEKAEWVAIPQNEFASRIGAHVNGVAKAVAILEASGAIESKKQGRAKVYRCLVEKWKALETRLVPEAYSIPEKAPGPWPNRQQLLERAQAAIHDHDCELGYDLVRAAQMDKEQKRSPEPNQKVSDTKPTLECGYQEPAASSPGESGAPPAATQQNQPVDGGKPTLECGYPQTALALTDEQFRRYFGIFIAAGKPLHEDDCTAAEAEWKKLDIAGKLCALQSAEEICRKTEDADFIPFPVNHLKKHPWTRRALPARALPVDRKPTKTESAFAAATRRFLEDS